MRISDNRSSALLHSVGGVTELLERMNDGVLIFDAQGCLMLFNGTASTLFLEAGETLADGAALHSVAERLGEICYPEPQQQGDLSAALEAADWRDFERPASLKTGKRLLIRCSKTESGLTLLILREITENWRLQLKLDDSLNTAITTLAELAEYRDTDTGEHILRVARLSYELARYLARQPNSSIVIDAQTLQHIGTASKLHDIGKVGIPDSILLKPGKLSAEERLVMNKHTVLGGETLRKASELLGGDAGFKVAAEIAFCHHERWDGHGYPFSLTGDAIPISARIVAVADVYDALCSRRPYKEPWTRERVTEYLDQNAGSQFDPAVVAALNAVLKARDDVEEIKWSTEMTSGCEEIDADHKELLVLLNQMRSPENREDRIATGYVLDELIGYSISHFAREERLMTQANYPALLTHTAIHNRMRAEVIHLSQKLKYSFTPELGEEVTAYLGRWLSTHILEEDKPYFPYVCSLKETSI